jgi:hypothetical protein
MLNKPGGSGGHFPRRTSRFRTAYADCFCRTVRRQGVGAGRPGAEAWFFKPDRGLTVFPRPAGRQFCGLKDAFATMAMTGAQAPLPSAFSENAFVSAILRHHGSGARARVGGLA